MITIQVISSQHTMWFGQLVIGPPGAGKSTYCHAMHQFLTSLGRKHVCINLDPANDNLVFEYDIDIRDLVDMNVVMSELGLGPNGGLIYAIQYLAENVDWLEDNLKQFPHQYVIIDFPGQIELYTNNFALKNIVDRLGKFGCQLTAMHLVDCTLCLDTQKYLSAAIVTLSGMMLLELPHVNLMSKVDLLKSFGKDLSLPFQVFADAEDMTLIAQSSRYPNQPRLRKLQAVIAELIEDYQLVSFQPLDIHDKKSMMSVLKKADQANGLGIAQNAMKGDYEFAFATTDAERHDLMEEIREKYIEASEDEETIEEINEEEN